MHDDAGPLLAGIDVGGTNTDAVVVRPDGTVAARAKVPTTDDPAGGIALAAAAVAGGGVTQVALGTTAALNAIVQRNGLRRVAVVRVGAPGTLAIPPLTGWPAELVRAVVASTAVLTGGVEIDGRIHALDPAALVAAGRDAVDRGARAVAVTGTFSPLDDTQEREAAAILANETRLPVTTGADVAGLGILEREHAAVLNAAIGDVIDRVVYGLEEAAATHFPGARVFVTQNDGTLMAPAFARRLPVLTIGSGPSNSLRGAVALTGLRDALVVDVGGTSTDVGALVRGFPRESTVGVEIGGVPTNFRMPDVVSVALGGGTIVDGGGALGIESVGRLLTREALVFGGSTPTLTDAAVADGRASVGDATFVRGLDGLATALVEATARVEEAVDRMRTTAEPVDLVLVGGGSIVLDDAIEGAGRVLRPHDADVANAVGAALAPVAGEADLIADVGPGARDVAIAEVVESARARATDAGADPATIETVWIDEVPLAYLDRPLSRLRAKVAGTPTGTTGAGTGAPGLP